jgi:hypothetical protein
MGDLLAVERAMARDCLPHQRAEEDDQKKSDSELSRRKRFTPLPQPWVSPTIVK